jgi:hypothetical protein
MKYFLTLTVVNMVTVQNCDVIFYELEFVKLSGKYTHRKTLNVAVPTIHGTPFRSLSMAGTSLTTRVVICKFHFHRNPLLS